MAYSLVAAAILGFGVRPTLSDGATPSDDARSFAKHVFETVGVAAASCPDDILALSQRDQSLFCGDADLEFLEFKRVWDRSLNTSNGLRIRAKSGWRDLGAWKIRRYSFERYYPMFVLFNESAGGVALVLGLQERVCDPSSEEEQRLDANATADDVTAPERIWRGDLPSSSKSAQVVIKARIDESGAVHPLCVLGAYPAGEGYEDAAIEAVRQWRFRPAVREGRPVSVSVSFWIDWKGIY